MPSKKAIVSGLIIFAVGMYAYNKIAPVRRVLGGG